MKAKLQLLVVAIAIALAFLIGRGMQADAQVSRAPHVAWEYKDGANLSAEQLNQMGAEGWEVAAVVRYEKDLYFLFKRAR
jgi:hypothetical protein